MSTTVVAPGPGSVYPIDDGWAAADVELKFETTSFDKPSDPDESFTVAVLELEGVYDGTYRRGVMCELTLDDCIELRERLSKAIAEITGMLP